jgi:hypothetical protein
MSPVVFRALSVDNPETQKPPWKVAHETLFPTNDFRPHVMSGC